MYIKSATIQNIRSIRNLTIDFGENPAGWHVLLGENGAGKSTIVKAIALSLIGPKDMSALSLKTSMADLLTFGEKEGSVNLFIMPHPKIDRHSTKKAPRKHPFNAKTKLIRHGENGRSNVQLDSVVVQADPFSLLWSDKPGWFSASFGPFRRFTGGSTDWVIAYKSNTKAVPHLSVFGEDVALTESLEWLTKLNNQRNETRYEGHEEAAKWLEKIKSFVNHGNWLPHGSKLHDVIFDKVIFIDANNQNVDVSLLSDGFRSILSLTFELLRQLVRTYGFEEIFNDLEKHNYNINQPGVVLIDEIDAHLHPTWQTEIGRWFTTRFPKLQFIVTTHSPLICRAAEKGSIWKLAKPGSGDEIREITGQDKNRLVFGNLLDAYGTDAFGEDVSQSKAGLNMGERMAELSKKAFKGSINASEKAELNNLKAQMPSVE